MKTQKTYSLFAKEGKKWTRLTPLALGREHATRLFQDALLGGTMNGFNMALRPAEDDFAHEAEYKANMTRVFAPKVKVLVQDHVTNAEGELVDAGMIEVELDD